MHYFSFSVFFFLMIRRPPRSTLFPTRRSSDLFGRAKLARPEFAERAPADIVEKEREKVAEQEALREKLVRSEEHTSELQSLAYLVCRLLLEKNERCNRPEHRSLCARLRPHRLG